MLYNYTVQESINYCNNTHCLYLLSNYIDGNKKYFYAIKNKETKLFVRFSTYLNTPSSITESNMISILNQYYS